MMLKFIVISGTILRNKLNDNYFMIATPATLLFVKYKTFSDD